MMVLLGATLGSYPKLALIQMTVIPYWIQTEYTPL